MDEDSTPDDNIFINPTDGLSADRPAENGFAADADDADDTDATVNEDADADADSFDDVPKSIIVTNIDADVFGDAAQRADMEELFRYFSDAATFQWLKSFRRLRVNFDSGLAAANARIQLHQYRIGRSVITCYFAQPVPAVPRRFLKPPAPFKQFLISPPASPPAGWEPRAEGEPLVNHDLLAALANLSPGESHQLHRPQRPEHPAIVVHTALVPDGGGVGGGGGGENRLDAGEIHEDEDLEADGGGVTQKARIPQTKCPARAGM